MQGEQITQFLWETLFSLAIFTRTFFQMLGIIPAPCEEPLQYTLGTIDPRFGISENQVLDALQEAEEIWEQASGKNLFEYNKEEGLPVQFVYDERQQKTQAEQELQERLGSINVEKSEEEAATQIAKYEQAKKEYEKRLNSYTAAADKYNEKVEALNKKGGATEKEQEQLAKEYSALQAQFQALEKTRAEVNSLVVTTNQHIKNNQSLVEAYNKEVTTFQEQYGGEGAVFDQGVYTGSDITIYQYEDTPRLILVLAHEMGHALGIDHVEAREALMYYLMKDQDIKNIALHEADIQAVKDICESPRLFWKQ